VGSIAVCTCTTPPLTWVLNTLCALPPCLSLQFLGKTEELMAALDEALPACGVPRRAFVLLGASTTRPREVYEVLLPAEAVGSLPERPAAAGSDAADDLQPLRELQQQQAAAEAPSASPLPAPFGGRPKLSRQERLCLLALRQLVVAGAELPEGTAHRGGCLPSSLLLPIRRDPPASRNATNSCRLH
jgi:hypothetical protein